jgi:hypothetical protein
MDNSTSSTHDSPNANDREAMPRELVIRLSTIPGNPRVSDPHVLFGQLPRELPPDIALPEGSRVLGTLIRGPGDATCVIDVDLPAEQVLEFYRERMQVAGWQESELPAQFRQGGFTHSGLELGKRVTFCHGSRGPSLVVSAHSRGESGTDLRLVVDLSDRTCVQQARMHRMTREWMGKIIPRLDPPSGVKQVMGGDIGGGNDSFYSNATLEASTPGDLTELAAHYATQLERAGWKGVEEGQCGPISWSAWTFQDEDKEAGRGFFFILRMPGQMEQYMLHLQVNLGTDSQPPGGWFSSAPLTRLT